jgi:hypothetical protein
MRETDYGMEMPYWPRQREVDIWRFRNTRPLTEDEYFDGYGRGPDSAKNDVMIHDQIEDDESRFDVDRRRLCRMVELSDDQ